ncbi:MAG: hypothetical protein KAU20_05710 [Nanoarchaeota archaeon]|nr:hypothetical protein [Nanoarchaeota archaeon]
MRDYCIENDLPRQQEMAYIIKEQRRKKIASIVERFKDFLEKELSIKEFEKLLK